MTDRDEVELAAGESHDGAPDEGSAPDEAGLERRLERLEAIVAALEADDLELDRALALFEEGITHVRRAEAILATTELRVEELLGNGAQARTRDFEAGSA